MEKNTTEKIDRGMDAAEHYVARALRAAWIATKAGFVLIMFAFFLGTVLFAGSCLVSLANLSSELS